MQTGVASACLLYLTHEWSCPLNVHGGAPFANNVHVIVPASQENCNLQSIGSAMSGMKVGGSPATTPRDVDTAFSHSTLRYEGPTPPLSSFADSLTSAGITFGGVEGKSHMTYSCAILFTTKQISSAGLSVIEGEQVFMQQGRSMMERHPSFCCNRTRDLKYNLY